MVFALPLILFPDQILTYLSWEPIDPFMSRLVGAALMGIGFGGFVNRNVSVEAYVVMLNMKIIWSISAVMLILITMISGGPVFGWFILFLFMIFAVVWIRYRVQLTREVEGGEG
jgi:hypothetical protein